MMTTLTFCSAIEIEVNFVLDQLSFLCVLCFLIPHNYSDILMIKIYVLFGKYIKQIISQ